MKSRILKKAAALMLCAVLVGACAPIDSFVEGVSLTASADDIINDAVYVDSWSGIQNAIDSAESSVTIVVDHDSEDRPLTPESGDKAITVPAGKTVNLYLNRSLDRGLTEDIADGCVIKNLGTLNILGFNINEDPHKRTANTISITGGKNTNNGGGIVNSGTLTAVNINLEKNHSSENGGGLYNSNTAMLLSCNVTGNEAGYYEAMYTGFGAGVYSGQGSNVIFRTTETDISGNKGTASGAGVYINGTMEIMGAVTILDNKATITRKIYDESADNYDYTNEDIDSNLELATYRTNSYQTKPSYSMLNIVGELVNEDDEKTQIRVTAPSGAFTSDYGVYNEEHPSNYFIPNDEDVKIGTDDEGSCTEAAAEYTYFKGAYMTCSEGLAVNFLVNCHSEFPNFQASVTWGDNGANDTQWEWKGYDKPNYSVLSVKIPAKAIGENIHVVLNNIIADYGGAQQIETLGEMDYSAAEYLDTILKDTTGEYSELDNNIAQCVYRYGMESAKLFNYTTKQPPVSYEPIGTDDNNNFIYPDPLTEEHLRKVGVYEINGEAGFVQEISEGYLYYGGTPLKNADLSDFGLSYYGMALELEDTTKIDLYFRVDPSIDLSNTIFYLDPSGDQTATGSEVDSIKFKPDGDGSKFIYVTLNGISPEQLLDPQTFVITRSDYSQELGRYDLTKTCPDLVVNAGEYINLALATDNTQLKRTVSALYNYSEEAKKYKNAQSGS